MSDLKPCPFCGAPAELESHPWVRNLPGGKAEIGGYRFSVRCTGRWEDDDLSDKPECHIHPSTGHEDSEYRVTTDWNRRHP